MRVVGRTSGVRRRVLQPRARPAVTTPVRSPGAAVVTAVAGALAAVLVAGTPAPAAADHQTGAPDTAPRLHLVTLAGPGTAGSPGGDAVVREELLRGQDAVLATVGGPEPVYRWTTALDGVAVRLDRGQADLLAADPRVALVEADAVRPLAGVSAPAAPDRTGAGPATGGRGTVVGVVDSGITPGSASFVTLPSLGRTPDGFEGTCAGGAADPLWSPSSCGGKVAAARWFVEGFGRDDLRSGSSLSPRDDLGHGTQMASIAAGNAAVPVRVPGQLPTTTGGQAPDARLAVYKACWSAPDPADDGCSTADLVTAVDRAVADGVDVLSLSVADRSDARDGRAVDTLERALLGAAEADVAVLAAAGNDPALPAAHDVAWVSTVGAAPGREPVGLVRVPGGPTLRGLTAARAGLPPTRLVVARSAPAEGVDPGRAAVCAPGSWTRPRSPAPWSCASAAASAAWTSPARSRWPTAPAWCCSTAAAGRCPPTSTPCPPSTSRPPTAAPCCAACGVRPTPARPSSSPGGTVPPGRRRGRPRATPPRPC